MITAVYVAILIICPLALCLIALLGRMNAIIEAPLDTCPYDPGSLEQDMEDYANLEGNYRRFRGMLPSEATAIMSKPRWWEN